MPVLKLRHVRVLPSLLIFLWDHMPTSLSHQTPGSRPDSHPAQMSQDPRTWERLQGPVGPAGLPITWISGKPAWEPHPHPQDARDSLTWALPKCYSLISQFLGRLPWPASPNISQQRVSIQTLVHSLPWAPRPGRNHTNTSFFLPPGHNSLLPLKRVLDAFPASPHTQDT